MSKQHVESWVSEYLEHWRSYHGMTCRGCKKVASIDYQQRLLTRTYVYTTLRNLVDPEIISCVYCCNYVETEEYYTHCLYNHRNQMRPSCIICQKHGTEKNELVFCMHTLLRSNETCPWGVDKNMSIFRYFTNNGVSEYTCVTTLNITSKNVPYNAMASQHLANNSNGDVRVLRLEGVVHYLPIGINKVFPNLTTLQVSHCHLKEITRPDLFGLEGLTHISMSYNDYSYLPDNLFVRMKNLRHISFNSYDLKYVNPEIIDPLLNNHIEYFLLSNGPDRRVGVGPGNNEHAVKEDINTRFERYINNNPSFADNFVQAHNLLWKSNVLTDFTIVCGDKKYDVHKTVLYTQSTVLAALLTSDMRETKQGSMEIHDVHTEAVKEFIDFLYTGIRPKSTHALDLCLLAELYDVPYLKSHTEDIIITELDVDNVDYVDHIAMEANSNVLKRAVEAFRATPPMNK